MFEKEMLKEFRVDFKKAMVELEEKYGVTASIGDITYGNTSFTSKLTVIKGSELDEMKRDYLSYCKRYGLSEDLYGKEVESNGKAYKLIGINSKARKYPIMFERVSDKEIYNFTVEEAKKVLEIK